MSRLERVALPVFGREEDLPLLERSEYEERLCVVAEALKKTGLDFLAVYADREHFANMAYLTGLDPRFEEALLLLDPQGRRTLLVGNEGMGYLPDPDLRCEVVLFQEFSLLGQPRERSTSLRGHLSRFGIGPGKTVGCAGWKYFEGPNVEGGAHALEIPSYLADLLRDLTGNARSVRNATGLFMNPTDGLRITNSAGQIAQFEFAASRTSESVLAALRHLREGVTEEALERHLGGGGLPCSCHPMISFGEKVKRGLSSPSRRPARLGDAFAVAYGIQGALSCRAGAVACGPEDLPGERRDFYPAFASNYFDVAAAWYESVKVGARAGEVFQAAESKRDPKLYDFCVNPGHYIHLDEWVHSPFYPKSPIALRSGMYLQMDIIPVSRGPFCYVNAEDGIVLADAELRSKLKTHHPNMWNRLQARQRFMRETLGIRLDESVLPLGNTPGWLPPYGLDLESVFVAGGEG